MNFWRKFFFTLCLEEKNERIPRSISIEIRSKFLEKMCLKIFEEFLENSWTCSLKLKETLQIVREEFFEKLLTFKKFCFRNINQKFLKKFCRMLSGNPCRNLPESFEEYMYKSLEELLVWKFLKSYQKIFKKIWGSLWIYEDVKHFSGFASLIWKKSGYPRERNKIY